MHDDTDGHQDSIDGHEVESQATTSVSVSSDYKVRGRTPAPNGAGVVGHNTATSGSAVGVEGVSDSSDGHAAGVEGTVNGPGYGVLGRAYDTAADLPSVPKEIPAGVIGLSDRKQGAAVFGYAANGPGVRAWSDDGTASALQVDNLGGGRAITLQGSIWTINEDFVVEAGDVKNAIEARNVVLGHGSNSVASGVLGASIGGGGKNDTSVDDSHAVKANFGTIAGGVDNSVGSDPSTPGIYATVGGGSHNNASSRGATVAGGEQNKALARGATIGGGLGNRAEAKYATVPGGRVSEAKGKYSFGAGRKANAKAKGAFVWADSSTQQVTSNVENEFKVQAGGGAVIYTKSDLSKGALLASGDTSWSATSSRAVKTDVEPVEPQGVLDAVEDIPISTWRYEGTEGIRHMGPMAEDFYEAFGLGVDDEHINTIDADGVALAAIKGLAERLERTNAALREALAERTDRLEAVEARLAAVEEELGADAPDEPAADPEVSR